jgi:hypothetical protein
MKRLLMLAGLAVVTLVIWHFGPEPAQKDSPTSSVAEGKRQGSAVDWKPATLGVSSNPNKGARPAVSAAAPHSPAEVGKVESTRELINRTTAYLQDDRPDLAQRSFQRLKSQRESLPEFLQIQVDRLEVLLQTDGPMGPQRTLKAAILANRKE